MISYEALGLSPLHGEYVAFLELYLDESYAEDDQHIVIAGFVASIDDWAQFSNAWKVHVLEQFGIPHLHMKELGSKRSGSFSGVDDPVVIAKRIIAGFADLGVGCVINRHEFDSAVSKRERSEYGTAYTVGVMACLQIVKDFLNHKLQGSARETTVGVILEDGHRNTRQAISILKSARDIQRQSWDVITRLEEGLAVWRNPERDVLEVKLGLVDSYPKGLMLPLQAADLLAHTLLRRANPYPSELLSDLEERMPIAVINPSIDSIKEAMANLDKHHTKVARRNRRSDAIIRDMREHGSEITVLDGTIKHNIDDFAEATSRVAKRFTKVPADSDSEREAFDRAMDTILRADPKAVKAAMEAEKAANAKKRKVKKRPSSSGPVSSGKD